MTLITEYSGWFFLLCLLIGALYSLFLYYKNRHIEYRKKSKIAMALLRGLAIFLIAYLLLAPMLKMTTKHKEKAKIVIAIDNSESLISGKDSLFYKKEFVEDVNKLIHQLAKEYEVKPYFIGEKVNALNSKDEISPDYKDKSTNLSDIFDHVAEVYANQNVGAMVLFSDGIFNVGSNPYYKTNQLKCPVYTVGLGNTELQTDLWIASIHHNRQTYKGNYFPVEINVQASKLAGKRVEIRVEDAEEKALFRKEIVISGANHFETVKFSLQAGEKGMHRYQVYVSELEGELTYKNNHLSFFVDVVDSKEKIAIIYHAPHPDISAIKQALETADKYEVELFSAETFHASPDDYSLIILHQLPSQRYPIGTLLADIQKKYISTLFILGEQTNLLAFNELNTGLIIHKNKQLFNDAFPLFNQNFSVFTFQEESKQLLTDYPPLHTFFGEYKLALSANVFLFQKINNVATDYPLVVFNQHDGMKTGVITGDGIWQWKMYNYVYAKNHDAFNELINKMALYLSVRADRSFFRVHAKTLYDENENIAFDAELYNESYELISDPEVKMVLTDEEGKQYSALFSKKYNAYDLNVGNLTPGDYRWEATTTAGGKNYVKSGSFMVRPIEIETQNLLADHALLQSIAQHTGGEFYAAEEINKLINDLKTNENITTISYFAKNYNLLLNSWLYFVVLVLLMGVEWFLRKWGGGY